jgi:DNA-binding Lrp family transcriptional regulator
MSKKKEFTGIWLTKELLADTRLTWADKILVAYVDSFGENFYAGNKHIAAMLGMTEQAVANRLVRLRKRGVFKERHLTKLVTPPYQIGNPDTKLVTPDTKSYIDNEAKTWANPQEASDYQESDEGVDISIEQNREYARKDFEPEIPGKLSESEMEAFLVDRGFGASIASRVFETLSASGWRRPDGRGRFADRAESERVALGLARKMEADMRRPPAPVSQFMHTH